MKPNSQKKRQIPSQPAGKRGAPELGEASTTAVTSNSGEKASTVQQGHRPSRTPAFKPINPVMDSPLQHGSHDPFSPTINGMLSGPQSPGSAMFLGNAPHGVPDLTAMMFPSSDPFAYPNQPITTLENQHQGKPETSSTQNPFNPPTSTAFPNMGNQGYSAMPDYSPMHPGQQNGLSMPPHSGFGVNGTDAGQPLAMPTRGDAWPHFRQPPQPIPNMPLDQLFGEDWGGWMNQGYRQ